MTISTTAATAAPGIPDTHYYRVFRVVSGFSIPITAAFALFHLLSAGATEFLKILPVPLLLLGTRMLADVTRARQALYLVHAAVVYLHLLRLMYVGAEDGSNIVWMMVCPLVAFPLLGMQRGSWFMLLAVAGVGLLLFLPAHWLPGRYDYPLPTRMRFMIVFLVVSFGSLLYERVREIHRVEMERRQIELQGTHRDLLHAKQKIEHMAITDSLTTCFNRHYLQDRVQQELLRLRRYGRPLALIVCDIDHFKAVNDRHGHAAGDRVLAGVGRLLQQSLRDEIDFVVRYGGEEFVLFLPEITAQDAALVADRIRRTLASRDFTGDGGVIRVTASFGVVGLSPDGAENVSYDELFMLADKLLYRSKKDGRNCVYYSVFGSGECRRCG